MNVTPREYAFYPSPDDPAAVGLLFVEGDAGDRGTVFVEAGWLRLHVVGQEAGVDLADLVVPDAVTMPHARPGWPDEWRDSDRVALHGLYEWLQADGYSWAQVRQELIERKGEDE